MVAKQAEQPQTGTAESKDDFDVRHQEDLGAKKFAVTQGKLVVIPLLTMALGGFVGYRTLGKPLTKMFPKFFEGTETAAEILQDARDMATGKQNARWNLKTAQWIGAGVLGTIGSMLGSVFVGYDKWRKEETTRLASEEIERDISKMELFRPSDPELVAENKRLRGMLAEAEQQKPAHHAGAVTHGGKPSHHIVQAEHLGMQQQLEHQLG